MKKDIKKILQDFSRLRIAVVGDVMIDKYIWGKVTRISPEAPVPIVSQTNSECRLGGAANVARNIISLKAEPILFSVIGDDYYGEIFCNLLLKEGISDGKIIKSKERITTVKTRIIAGSQQLLRVDNEIENSLSEELEQQLFESIKPFIIKNSIDALIFEDYDKGVITPYLINEIVKLCNEYNIPVLVDPKRRNFHFYKNVTLFKPNFKEISEALNLNIEKTNIEALKDAALKLHNNYKIKIVMITLSENGIFISDTKSYYHIPAIKRDIADVSGAGDTVVSVAALSLALNLKINQIAYICNIAGGIVCEKVGVVPIDTDSLLKECLFIPED